MNSYTLNEYVCSMPIQFVFSAKSEWVGNLLWNGNGFRKKLNK